MSLALILAPLLAQIGPSVSGGAGRPLPSAPLEIPRPGSKRGGGVFSGDRLDACLDEARRDPAAALRTALAWRDEAKGKALAEAWLCAGASLSAQDRSAEAEAAYLAARDRTAGTERRPRALLGAMAGEEALKLKAWDRAELAYGLAQDDAKAAGSLSLAGEIAAHRSRAAVGAGQLDRAAALLAEARQDAPESGLAWLLSATLSRRQNQLAEAQKHIEMAARLSPQDPAVGLEAGVIAVLAGRDDAARKAWEAVRTMAPDSPEAAIAKGYLDQLGAAPPQPAK